MNLPDLLIIDDDTVANELLIGALKNEGVHNIQIVTSGSDAIQFLDSLEKAELPKIVIVGHYLLGMTAHELIKNLRKNERYKQLYVIVTSFINLSHAKETYKQVGIFDFIRKPFYYDNYLPIAVDIRQKLNQCLSLGLDEPLSI